MKRGDVISSVYGTLSNLEEREDFDAEVVVEVAVFRLCHVVNEHETISLSIGTAKI